MGKNALTTVDGIKANLLSSDVLSAYMTDGKMTMRIKDNENSTDGKTVYAEITVDGTTAVHASALKVIADFEKMTDKAKCFHIAELTDKDAKKFGYKNKIEMLECNIAKLSPARISRLTRIGKIFITHSLVNEDGTPKYAYRDGIPFNASISNLAECLPLLTDESGNKLDWTAIDKFTESECEDIVKRFVATYIDTCKLHLASSGAEFREEISAYKGSKGNDANKPKKDTDSKDNKLSDKERAITAIDTLRTVLGGNDSIMEYLDNILDYVNKHMTDSDSDSDSDSETENA